MGVGQLVAALCPEVLRYAQTSSNTYALVHKCPRDFPGLGIPEGGRTPLMIKSKKGHEAAVRLLLQYGADVSPRDFLVRAFPGSLALTCIDRLDLYKCGILPGSGSKMGNPESWDVGYSLSN